MGKISVTEKTNWLSVLLLWAIGLAAAMQFAKLSVTLDDLAIHYVVSESLAALVLSSIGFMGILLGAAAGTVVGSVGPRRALLVAMSIGVFVSSIQAFLPPFLLFLASRLIEGVSHLLIVVAAPTAIIAVSAPRHTSLTMGLWATFFGVAYALAGYFGPSIQAQFGFSAVYGSHAGLMILLLAVFVSTYSASNPTEGLKLPRNGRQAWRTQFEVYRATNTSIPALAFLWHTLMFVALLTFLPGLGNDEGVQRLLATILPVITIVGSFAGGAIAQRLNQPILQLQVGFVVFAALSFLLALSLQTQIFMVAACAVMFVSGIIQASTFAAIPQLCHDGVEQARANGGVTQLGNLGATCGTPLFAAGLVYAGSLAVPLFAGTISLLAVIMLGFVRRIVARERLRSVG